MFTFIITANMSTITTTTNHMSTITHHMFTISTPHKAGLRLSTSTDVYISTYVAI